MEQLAAPTGSTTLGGTTNSSCAVSGHGTSEDADETMEPAPEQPAPKVSTTPSRVLADGKGSRKRCPRLDDIPSRNSKLTKVGPSTQIQDGRPLVELLESFHSKHFGPREESKKREPSFWSLDMHMQIYDAVYPANCDHATGPPIMYAPSDLWKKFNADQRQVLTEFHQSVTNSFWPLFRERIKWLLQIQAHSGPPSESQILGTIVKAAEMCMPDLKAADSVGDRGFSS